MAHEQAARVMTRVKVDTCRVLRDTCPDNTSSHLGVLLGLPTRCALPDNIDRYAVNRPSPAEAVEKVSARLEEVQHAIQFGGKLHLDLE